MVDYVSGSAPDLHAILCFRIRNLTANPLKVKPAVNQVELNFYNPQPELLQWSNENGILLEAYSPLGSARQVKDMLSLPVITGIAEDLGISPAQVVISWHVQRGVSRFLRLQEPALLFDSLDYCIAEECHSCTY